MLTALFTALAATLPFCDKPAPEPRGFHSRGFGQVVEIFPPRSRRNPGERPMAYLYEVGFPGTRWDVEARRAWTATLPHAAFPQDALVSTDGHVVTLDDYWQTGREHAVVVFDARGRQRSGYRLEELLTAEQIADLEWSDCGIQWRLGAKYFFVLDAAPHLYIVLPSVTLQLDLTSGGFRRGPAASFPELTGVMSRPFPDEEAHVWATSLRFSSITDVLGGPPDARR
jgi:hypothetical protein